MRTAQPAAVDNHLCCGQPASEKAWGLDAPSRRTAGHDTSNTRARHAREKGASVTYDLRRRVVAAVPRRSGAHRYYRADVFAGTMLGAAPPRVTMPCSICPPSRC